MRPWLSSDAKSVSLVSVKGVNLVKGQARERYKKKSNILTKESSRRLRMERVPSTLTYQAFENLNLYFPRNSSRMSSNYFESLKNKIFHSRNSKNTTVHIFNNNNTREVGTFFKNPHSEWTKFIPQILQPSKVFWCDLSKTCGTTFWNLSRIH